MELLAAIMIPAALAAVSVVSIRLAMRRQARPKRTAREHNGRAAGGARRRSSAMSRARDWQELRLAAGRWTERLRAELYRLPPDRLPPDGPEPSPAPPAVSGWIAPRGQPPEPRELSTVYCASCGLEQPAEYVRCLRCGSVDRRRGVEAQRAD